MSKITIADVDVRQDAEGRYSLNDLHRASGGERKHGPSLWLENQQTKELIAELALEMGDTGFPVSVIRGGAEQGSYGCKELVYAYAMWISARFHLEVIRAYDRKVTGEAAAAAPALPDFSNPAAAARAWADQFEEKTQARIERDEAVRTKAMIGHKREATAMATASRLSREVGKLRDQLGFSTRQATVMQVEEAMKRDYEWRPLRKWCLERSIVPEIVPDKRFPNGVKAWPASAWLAVYGIDLERLFGTSAPIPRLMRRVRSVNALLLGGV